MPRIFGWIKRFFKSEGSSAPEAPIPSAPGKSVERVPAVPTAPELPKVVPRPIDQSPRKAEPPQSPAALDKHFLPASANREVEAVTPKMKSGVTGVASKPSKNGKPPSASLIGEASQSSFIAPPRPPRADEKDAESRRLAAKIEALPVAIEQRAREAASACRATSREVAELHARLTSGMASTFATAPKGRTIDVVLGVDFGTSCTKIVARLPYEGGEKGIAFAIPAPSFAQAEGHPYLWASRLWLTSGGVFSLLPMPGAAVSCALKAGLMAHPQSAAISNMTVEASAEEAACAFLALQLRQARGWLATERSTHMQRGLIRWSYNFGFPAASLNNRDLRDRYQRCIAAALSLADQPSGITLAATRASLTAETGNSGERLERAQAALVPEIAAAVSGFANSSMLDDGLYAIVDVGGATVDCCTFNLFKGREGAARCPIFLADVAMLGAEVWQGCANDPSLANYFRWDLDRRQRSVVRRTKQDRDPRSDRWVQGLPIFFVGGGIQSLVHRASTGSLDAWLRHLSPNSGGCRLVRLPPPESLDHELCEDTEVHRLAVAVGLSLPIDDIPEVTLPDEIADVERRRRHDEDERFIGKEQT